MTPPSLAIAQLADRLTDTSTELGEGFLSWMVAAQIAHPELRLERATFARHVASIMASSGLSFDQLCAADLYLAAGCTRQDATALTIFEERYLRSLRTQVGTIDGNADRLDELKQMVREKLLVKEPNADSPRIGTYTGRGTLGAWVHVTARRLALSVLRKKSAAELPDDDALEDHMVLGIDPELDYVRIVYAQEFRQALEASLRQLKPQERVLMRLHWVDGVSLTRIARAYGVSQSTISRQLQKVRDAVAFLMRDTLKTNLGVTASEVDSLARLFESRFTFSLARVLSVDEASRPDDPGKIV